MKSASQNRNALFAALALFLAAALRQKASRPRAKKKAAKARLAPQWRNSVFSLFFSDASIMMQETKKWLMMKG